MDRNAEVPSMAPTSPGRIRWTLVGPNGTWMSEATKKAEVTTATLGRSTLRVRAALKEASAALAT